VKNNIAVYTAIGAGAVAGIVIAVILCVLCSAGGSYAVATRMQDEDDASVHNNPLYASESKGGLNPLHEEEKN